MSFNNELQRAVFQRLKGYQPLTDLVSTYNGQPAIFFDVPQEVQLPEKYVVVYNFDITAEDTDNTDGFTCNFDVHSWVTDRTARNVGNITQQVYNALHRYNSILDGSEGFESSGMYFVGQNILKESDGVTKHAIQEFTVQFDPLVIYPECN